MAQAPAIDIHAHYYPPAFLKLFADEGPAHGAACDCSNPAGPVLRATHPPSGFLPPAGPLRPEFRELPARLEDMDRLGVRMHALSLTQPGLYWAGADLGLRLAQAFNDAVAEAHTLHPGRFVGLAALPLQDVPAAARELERAARLPGIRGLYMPTRVIDRELSDPAFLPIFERAESLGLPVFLHPLNVIGSERLTKGYFLVNLLGNPFDNAVAAAQLIFGGVLDRFPRLELCLPHAGGAFPYLVGRLDQGWRTRAECKHLPQAPSAYLRRFHFDTVCFSHAALAFLVEVAGADRIMTGSDYCFDIGYRRPVEFVTGHPRLNQADRDLILGGNAARLLKL